VLAYNRRMADRSRDWLAQAERDLEVAAELRERGTHEWACFAAQQAAEKAVKAAQVSPTRASGVRELLQMLPCGVSEMLIHQARVLDAYFIQTRDVYCYDSGAPFEYYGARQSNEAIRFAGEIVQFARSLLAATPSHA
jgi:HEPN domain-containing protein